MKNFFRFFFVSGSELLEFLSNGNEPDKVMRLLKKVFDSLNKLDLREDSNGNKLKIAYASKAEKNKSFIFFFFLNLEF